MIVRHECECEVEDNYNSRDQHECVDNFPFHIILDSIFLSHYVLKAVPAVENAAVHWF